jgi:predicted CoA-binding protein
MTPPDPIPWILTHCRTIAVVGLSPKPHRASYDVSQYMQRAGFRIVPVNPNAREVLGERAYASLRDAAAAERIDLVNVFRNSEDVPPVIDEAIAIGAKAVWLQLGVVHDAAAAKAQAAGLVVVQDRCLKIEHARRAGRGMNAGSEMDTRPEMDAGSSPA